eukprot:6181805-Pleurochrysis_carterae.AAC.1
MRQLAFSPLCCSQRRVVPEAYKVVCPLGLQLLPLALAILPPPSQETMLSVSRRQRSAQALDSNLLTGRFPESACRI